MTHPVLARNQAQLRTSYPQPEAVLKDVRASSGQQSLLAITGLHDVEEDIWSHAYGLKGRIDASLQAVVVEQDGIQRQQSCWSLPFEIKTGRTVAGVEHRAQTMLYTLLMSERYGGSASTDYLANTLT